MQNKTYPITTPYGEWLFTFDDRDTLCESIKVNQVGYHKDSTMRYAVLGVYMGDGGSVQFDPLPTFDVVDADSGDIVTSGTAVFIKDDTAVDGFLWAQYHSNGHYVSERSHS